MKGCQYPKWGDELPPLSQLNDGSAYCGKARRKDSPYCEEHFQLCRRKYDPTAEKVQWDFKGKKRSKHGLELAG